VMPTLFSNFVKGLKRWIVRAPGPSFSLYTNYNEGPSPSPMFLSDGLRWYWRADIFLNARRLYIPFVPSIQISRRARVIEVDCGRISIDGIHWYGDPGNSWMILPLGERP
jgi:hypothetical protein